MEIYIEVLDPLVSYDPTISFLCIISPVCIIKNNYPATQTLVNLNSLLLYYLQRDTQINLAAYQQISREE